MNTIGLQQIQLLWEMYYRVSFDPRVSQETLQLIENTISRLKAELVTPTYNNYQLSNKI